MTEDSLINQARFDISLILIAEQALAKSMVYTKKVMSLAKWGALDPDN